VRKSLPQEPNKSHVESSSIALARSHRRPTYSSMKIRQGLKRPSTWCSLSNPQVVSLLLNRIFEISIQGIQSISTFVMELWRCKLATDCSFQRTVDEEKDCDTTRIIYLPPHPPELLNVVDCNRIVSVQSEPHADVLRLKSLIQKKVGILVWLQHLKYILIELEDDARVGPNLYDDISLVSEINISLIHVEL
jgi:hypothetical protein